ncbi:DUF397 domain-containing protein [Kutzneria buriramensis]|uniref:Uncharacterized protein DUF397 n=1 Tax=Kutzneria buriramensis TaxID=1045776 RepID=A0A3E0HPE8_9PSEU|nr:DUF397 domain-containing protein [Kutzneria buriramensis]REH48299.1 uncharacterized protein DUF397 [Kutzneria buriramensis]
MTSGTPVYRKSSYSGEQGDCVEVAFIGDEVSMRDSKNPAVGDLRVSDASWRRFLATAARRGFTADAP